MRTSEETEKISRPDLGGHIVLAHESQGWVENCQVDKRKGILGREVITAKTHGCEGTWYLENDMEMNMLGVLGEGRKRGMDGKEGRMG